MTDLPLGLLTLQPMPELPGFDIYPEGATSEGGPSTCELINGGSVQLSPGTML